MTARIAPSAVLALTLGLGAAFAPSPVGAQSAADLERARTLYTQGIEQEAAGEWAGALATFEKVAAIKTTPQVRFHIARCKEHLGRLNEALGGYRLAQHEALEAGKDGEKVLPEVQKALAALEKRVPSLIIERGDGTDSATIELDGVALGGAKIGRPVNVDPGPHLIQVTLADGREFKRTVHVKEGESLQVILDVPEDLAPKAAPAPAPAVGSSPEPAPPPPDDPPSDGASASLDDAGGSALPWVITGVGVASLAASGVFYLIAKNAEDELDRECLADICPDTLQDTQTRGERFSLLTGVALGVGALGVGVGVTMLLGEAQSDEGVALNVRGSGNFTGVDVVGRF